MLLRIHDRTDRYAAAQEGDARQRAAETQEHEAKLRRVAAHERDRLASYRAARLYADHVQILARLGGLDP